MVFAEFGTCAPSSASSVIPPSLCRRSEDEESEVSDPTEACSMQADASVCSVSSLADLNENTVSCGVNVSTIDWNCTVSRAKKLQCQCGILHAVNVHTNPAATSMYPLAHI